MNDFVQALHNYCEDHSTAQSQILHELERETHLKTLAPQMVSGHLQGQFLSLLSKLMQPKIILEIGAFTGYASICLAQGLQEGGILHAIEVNPELEYIAKKYYKKAGLEEKIKLHIGNAKSIIPNLNTQFDIVFIDAGKNDYAFFYDLVIEMVNPGGLILADNVLWSGKVIKGATDKDTKVIDAFNKKVKEDDRVENIFLPIRDGLVVARKVSKTL